jgi:acyl transferase domain-containing protein
MISHTIPAAGIAGIIKTSLALYHRVLPPTLNVEEPNPKLQLERTPFYLNTETRPWIADGAQPRRAAVNAFGFGGINAHAVLEEVPNVEPNRHLPAWPDDVVLLEAASVEALQEQVSSLADAVRRSLPAEGGTEPYRLVDLAYTLAQSIGTVSDPKRLAIVATSLEDLAGKLELAATKLAKPGVRKIKHSSGIYFTAEPLASQGGVAFVFPGEGAQYPGMLADHCMNFPEVRAIFDRADRIHEGPAGKARPSDLIFPRPTFSEPERLDLERQLFQMDNAVQAVLVANAAMAAMMELLDVRADVCVGHSSGEFSAALATGLLDVVDDERELTRFIRNLQECYTRAESLEGVPRAVLLAIAADRERVDALLATSGGNARVALDNCRHQNVVVGTAQEITSLRSAAEASGLICEILEYDRAVHTPDFRPYADELTPIFEGLPLGAPRVPLWSSATSGPYPSDGEQARRLFVDQWTMPVEWRRTVEKLYDEGVRIFIEVGPRGNLTAFVDDILRGKPSLAVAADVPRRRGTSSLNHLVGLLTVNGVSMNLDALYRRREPVIVDWTEPVEQRPDNRIALIKGWPAMTQRSTGSVRRARTLPSRRSRHLRLLTVLRCQHRRHPPRRTRLSRPRPT